MCLEERIAKAWGWWYSKAFNWWYYKDTGIFRSQLPQVNLDLMHELEGELSEDEKQEYIGYLTELTDTNFSFYNDFTEEVHGIFRYTHATAEQKAQAWLKVKEGR